MGGNARPDHVHDLERTILIKDRQLFELNRKLDVETIKRQNLQQANIMLRESIAATQKRIREFLQGIL